MRYLRGFGLFWYDFLVGDRPELFVAPIIVLAALWAALQAGLESTLAGFGLTLLVLVVGTGSLLVATRPRR